MNKNKIVKIGGTIGLFLLIISCNKNEKFTKSFEEGTYLGTFNVEYFANMKEDWWSSNGTLTLELKNGKYTCTSNVPPMAFSGNYSISNDKIVFDSDYPAINDSTFLPERPYFDVALILNGEYKYTFNGKRLQFSTIKDYLGNYKYELEKQ